MSKLIARAKCENENWDELPYQSLPKDNQQSTLIFKPLTYTYDGVEFTLHTLQIKDPNVQSLLKSIEARISEKGKDLHSENKFNSFDLEMKSYAAH